MGRADELIAAGEEAARAALPTIRELLAPAPAEPAPRWFSALRRRRQSA
jgi:hypothetical protein